MGLMLSNPFARTREDHRAEVAEDYVELIHRLGRDGDVRTTDLAGALGVAQPTVTKALDRLERSGLVVVNPTYTLKDELDVLLPFLKERLAQDRFGLSRCWWLRGE